MWCKAPERPYCAPFGPPMPKGSDPLEDPVSELDSIPVPVARTQSRAEVLLRAGIPLSLLLDLAGSDPHSDELYTLERAS